MVACRLCTYSRIVHTPPRLYVLFCWGPFPNFLPNAPSCLTCDPPSDPMLKLLQHLHHCLHYHPTLATILHHRLIYHFPIPQDLPRVHPSSPEPLTQCPTSSRPSPGFVTGMTSWYCSTWWYIPSRNIFPLTPGVPCELLYTTGCLWNTTAEFPFYSDIPYWVRNSLMCSANCSVATWRPGGVYLSHFVYGVGCSSRICILSCQCTMFK